MKSTHSIAMLAALGVVLGAGVGPACSSDDPQAQAPQVDAGPTPLQPLEATFPGIIPPDKRLDRASSPVIFDARRGGVWTANGDVGSIGYVDVDARKVVREIAIGPGGGDIRSVAPQDPVRNPAVHHVPPGLGDGALA